jgi:hypothetical protein
MGRGRDSSRSRHAFIDTARWYETIPQLTRAS